MLLDSHGTNRHECLMSITTLDTQDPGDLLWFLVVTVLRKSTEFSAFTIPQKENGTGESRAGDECALYSLGT